MATEAGWHGKQKIFEEVCVWTGWWPGGPCPSCSDQKVLLITWQYDVSVLNCRPWPHSIIGPPRNVIAHKYPQIPITEALTLQPTNFN